VTPLLLGATLVSVVGLLAAAAFGRHYQSGTLAPRAASA
jgi:hypothetical protein